MKNISTVKDLSEFISGMVKLPILGIEREIKIDAQINPENDYHIPIPGCNKLAFIRASFSCEYGEVVAKYPISLNIMGSTASEACQRFFDSLQKLSQDDIDFLLISKEK